jgi:hypothetical protein
MSAPEKLISYHYVWCVNTVDTLPAFWPDLSNILQTLLLAHFPNEFVGVTCVPQHLVRVYRFFFQIVFAQQHLNQMVYSINSKEDK